MDDRTDRLQLLYALFERELKRELTPEERRLLALSDSFCRPAKDEDRLAGDGDGAARGEFAS